MDFFLPFQIQPFPFKFSYQDKILFIGSCFSNEIGNKMEELKFDILQNPNGILYNPLCISEALQSCIENKFHKEEDLFLLNGFWHSWKHHSVFSGINKKLVLEKINQSQKEAHTFLKQAQYLFITFGTAFNYQLKSNNENVANCHKAPTDFFIKSLLQVDKMKGEFLNVLNELEIFNPGLQIIFTISPVKHVREGVVENNRSKARLIEVINSIIEEKRNTFYFPSYELVTDVLRDYRFYKNDLVHPNETAVNFVFEKFSNSLIDDESKKIMGHVRNIMRALNHKPFFKESEAHLKFITAQLNCISELENQYPFLNFSREKKIFLSD